ncbi:MAG: SUMF1/EgtB/PvdO family nonheme iron enzyme [Deltaproteobacteria bacterium]|nr:SUMF1/EgtB/PvdO family nonheme iron enzyme [Deltaproteobacteria bacterium]
MGSQLQDILALEPEERVEQLSELLKSGMDALDPAELVPAIVAVLDEDAGLPRDRCVLARALSQWGDPRLLLPTDPGYWIHIAREDGVLDVARDVVTNHEFSRFVEVDGYARRAWWSDEGWAWLQTQPETWRERRELLTAEGLAFANYPVVGVNWYEAEAFALAHGARLLDFDERLWVVRGEERRPYPWGAPFRGGKANTREEVLGHPCAVGLFIGDRTPEGVRDLAGNVAEWTSDEVGQDRWLHPGSWNEPSMASWAKARAHKSPTEWARDLGFRICRG